MCFFGTATKTLKASGIVMKMCHLDPLVGGGNSYFCSIFTTTIIMVKMIILESKGDLYSGDKPQVVLPIILAIRPENIPRQLLLPKSSIIAMIPLSMFLKET